MRVVVLDDYQQVAASLGPWSDLGPELDLVTLAEHLTGDELLAAIGPADVLVAMRERTAVDAELLAGLPALRLIVTTGMANVAIDLAAAAAHAVPVVGTESPPGATAELTWGLIHALTRQIPAEDATVRSGGWQTRLGGALAGRTLGVVGLGRLGSRVARVGLAFDLEVIAWSANLDPAYAEGLGVRAVGKRELFKRADIATVHLKLSPRSQGIVGADELRLMKPTAYLVNTSRSGLIDQIALRQALEEGWIAGLGVDVYDEEPLPADSWWRSSPRTVLTPHVGYVTRETYDVFFRQVVEDIAEWRSGRLVRQLPA
jgi:phosphoglycerate dehydrogenase-like enzyme